MLDDVDSLVIMVGRGSADHPSIIPRSSNQSQSQNQNQNQNQPREKGRARYDKKQVRQEVVLATSDLQEKQTMNEKQKRTEWKRTFPKEPGHYIFKLLESDEVEVIQCYKVGKYDGMRSYGWADRELLLAKRTHDPEAIEAEALFGFYICDAESAIKAPIPIDMGPVSVKPTRKREAKKPKNSPARLPNASKQEDGRGAVDDDAPGVGA